MSTKIQNILTGFATWLAENHEASEVRVIPADGNTLGGLAFDGNAYHYLSVNAEYENREMAMQLAEEFGIEYKPSKTEHGTKQRDELAKRLAAAGAYFEDYDHCSLHVYAG